MQDRQRPFMTTGDIVQFAKVHPNTVALWRATRKIIPKDRVGNSFLYSRKEVMVFLEKRNKERGNKDNG